MTSHYVLCHGWVRSRTDGDAHFIGASQLAHLYGVPFRDCYVMPSDWLSLPRSSAATSCAPAWPAVS